MTDEEKVVRALENPEYSWRTMQGIVRETGLAEEQVQKLMTKLVEQVIRTTQPNESGQYLFTTRKHFASTQSLISRSLSAVTGQYKVGGRNE